MKTAIQHSLKQLLADQYLLILSCALILLSIACAIYIGLMVKPSDLQLVSHYSAFGVTHLYRDLWFYLLSFGGFAFVAAVLHVIIGIKLMILKGHSLAILFVWLGIAVVLLSWIIAMSVLNIWSPSL